MLHDHCSLHTRHCGDAKKLAKEYNRAGPSDPFLMELVMTCGSYSSVGSG